MRCTYACGSTEHLIARRQFLGGVAGGALVGGLSILVRSTVAQQISRDQKRILVVNLLGGLSQFESWDPKPGTSNGGPFRAIPTSVPGLHISELLPYTAKQMHHLAVIRGMNTNEADHDKAQLMMLTGRRQTSAGDYPVFGAVAAKALAPHDSPLPGNILIRPGGSGRSKDAAYLGPKYSSIVLGNGNPPGNSARDAGLTADDDDERNAIRRRVNDRFAARRRTPEADAYGYSFEQARQLMERRDVFDVTKEPAADLDRYGTYDFGRHCLLARRLLENGVTFVQVAQGNYDTHGENFDFHLDLLNEFDRSFAALVADIADRGMLDSTLIVVLSEFGRTPHINEFDGRDHWSDAWSVVLGGCRIPRGAVWGKTNENCTEVIDGQVDQANLFHTYLQAVGLDSTETFDVDGRSLPIADPDSGPIKGLLA